MDELETSKVTRVLGYVLGELEGFGRFVDELETSKVTCVSGEFWMSWKSRRVHVFWRFGEKLETRLHVFREIFG